MGLAEPGRLTFHNDEVDWFQAKASCEALGQRLAVLDTMEKHAELDPV